MIVRSKYNYNVVFCSKKNKFYFLSARIVLSDNGKSAK